MKNRDPNTENQTSAKSKVFDLQPRTLQFAKDVRNFVKALPGTIANLEDIRQLIRASGSVGANYIEANEALGKKDFAMHIKISRKEAKESRFWLNLVDVGSRNELNSQRKKLEEEAFAFIKIFSAILAKVE
jgi:four helix bundle protein